MPYQKRFRLLLAFLIVSSVGKAWSLDESKTVVILANANDPSSVEIANYYADKRGIPAANIIALPMPDEETISLRSYVDTLHNPLLNCLIENEWVHAVKAREPDFTGRERIAVGLHRMSYLVIIRGVPLRIANDPELLDQRLDKIPDNFRVNNASVDSELALLIGPKNLSMTAFVANPLFENAKSRVVKPERVIRISRLDGPDVEAVKRMIDRTLQAEAEGLIGRAYFDSGGPHALGDEWICSAGKLAENAFFDTDCETTQQEMDETHRFDMPAIYMGWYRPHAYGPWIEPRWPVPPGAIGFHLHSFSATTVRSASKGWLGAFIRQGYCATVGNVYEPYLEYTHRPDILLKALLDGHSFGEAVMLSLPVFSWQGVSIGDPLYRPFKVDLSTQLEDAENNPLSAYVYLREINRLEAVEGADKALLFAQAQFRKQPSLPLMQKLAQLYTSRGELEKAVEALEIVRSIKVFAKDEVMLVREIASFLSQQGQHETALEIYRTLINGKEPVEAQRALILREGARVALLAGDALLFSTWTKAAEDLVKSEE